MNNMTLARLKRLNIRCSVLVEERGIQLYMMHGSRQLSRRIEWNEVQNGIVEMVDLNINSILKELGK